MSRKSQLDKKVGLLKTALFRDSERINLVTIHRVNPVGKGETLYVSPKSNPSWAEDGQEVFEGWLRDARAGIASFPDRLSLMMDWPHRHDDELVISNLSDLTQELPGDTLFDWCMRLLAERIFDEEIPFPSNGRRTR